MEILCCSSITIGLIVTVLVLLLLWYRRASEDFKFFEKLGVKGPKASLFKSGNMNTMLEKGFMKSFIDWEKEYGRVYGVFRSRRPTLVVTDPELLREIMAKNFTDWPNRQSTDIIAFKPWSETLLMLKDDHWKHVRNQLSPIFSSGKIKKMVPVLKRCCKDLVDNIRQKSERDEEVDTRLVTNAFSIDVIAGTAFGMEVNSLKNPEEKIVNIMHRLMYPSQWIIFVVFMFPWLAPYLNKIGIAISPPDAVDYVINIVRKALKQRRQEDAKYPDMLQLMAEAENEYHAQKDSKKEVDPELDHSEQLRTSAGWTRKGLTQDEIEANILVFLTAGYDTMSSAIAFLLYSLAGNPDILKKAQDEIDRIIGDNEVDYKAYTDLPYLDMCMSESLRLYPPGFLLDRESTEEMDFAGLHLPPKMLITIPVYSIHTNPQSWPDPMKFDPERFTPEAKASRNPFSYLAFGQGPRNCIGMRLGQLEVKMAVASILQKFSPVLCSKSVYPPKLSKHFRFGSDDPLWLKFKPRK